jgi:deoxyribonuclease-4
MAGMVPDGRRIGAHLPAGGGHVRMAERARDIGATALQVFTDNPSAWRRREEPPDDLPHYRSLLATYDIDPVAVHASYLVNLAGPDDELHDKSVALLASELTVAPAFGARFVNVHIGSHKGAGLYAGLARIADGVARALGESPDGPVAPMVVLENSAGSGFAIGVTLSEIAELLETIAARGVPSHRTGICFDTAHAWGAGFDLSTVDGVDRVVEDLDRLIGLERLVMIHLNDSKAALGSRSDRHQHIGAGEIGVAGLTRVVTHPRLAHVTYILETPGMDDGYDAVNLARVRALQRGEPLDPLPPEADDLPSGRHQARGAGESSDDERGATADAS